MDLFGLVAILTSLLSAALPVHHELAAPALIGSSDAPNEPTAPMLDAAPRLVVPWHATVAFPVRVSNPDAEPQRVTLSTSGETPVTLRATIGSPDGPLPGRATTLVYGSVTGTVPGLHRLTVMATGGHGTTAHVVEVCVPLDHVQPC